MFDPSQEIYVFHVGGMHCKACALLIEEIFTALPNVESTRVSLATHQVSVTGDFVGSPEEIAEELTKLVQSHSYTISVEKNTHRAGWGDFTSATPIAAAIILAFLLLQKAGLTSLITSSNVSYGTAFVIGLIASVSSCLAIVGGLVLSLSASSAKEGGTWRTQTLFHVGRLGGFFILGGAIGLIGSSFQVGLTVNVVLGILVALVMFIFGVNLLDVFHFTKRLQISLPTWLSKYVVRGSKHDHY